MSTFNEANQARLSLKLKLANYSFYSSSIVASDEADDGYRIIVNVKRLDDSVRKVIPTTVNGVSVKIELE